MNQTREIQLKLSYPMFRVLTQEAAADDVTPGQIIRAALAAELRRRHKAKTARRANEQLVTPLRVLLAGDLAEGRDWADHFPAIPTGWPSKCKRAAELCPATRSTFWSRSRRSAS